MRTINREVDTLLKKKRQMSLYVLNKIYCSYHFTTPILFFPLIYEIIYIKKRKKKKKKGEKFDIERARVSKKAIKIETLKI
jgi:hypothetical protein